MEKKRTLTTREFAQVIFDRLSPITDGVKVGFAAVYGMTGTSEIVAQMREGYSRVTINGISYAEQSTAGKKDLVNFFNALQIEMLETQRRKTYAESCGKRRAEMIKKAGLEDNRVYKSAWIAGTYDEYLLISPTRAENFKVISRKAI